MQLLGECYDDSVEFQHKILFLKRTRFFSEREFQWNGYMAAVTRLDFNI